MAEKKTEEKEKQTITKDEVGSLDDVLGTPKSLPKLIGGFVTRVMGDPRTLNECGHELSMWHDAQPVENRQQLVRETRKSIETAKQVTEWLYSQYQMISQKDA